MAVYVKSLKNIVCSEFLASSHPKYFRDARIVETKCSGVWL
jgi:hypothetical protein